MKKFLLFHFLFIISICSKAQSTDLDREEIPVSYVQLPTNPVQDEKFRTYSIDLNSTEEAENAYPSKLIKQEIILDGFEKINSNGTIDVQIQIGDIIVDEVEYLESEDVQKNKEGKVISRQTYFKPIINYKTNASYFIKDHKGERKEYLLNEDQNFKGIDYKSRKEAEDYVKTNISSLKGSFNKDFIKTISNNINRNINSSFGYVSLNKRNVDLWILDSKNHPENEGHQNALVQTRKIFGKMEHNKPITEIREEIAPVIAYFESVIPKYTDPKKAKHRKIRYASYYNVSKIYYYLDMPEKASMFADKIIENDYDKKDGIYLKEQAEQLKEKFMLNGTDTRHFEVLTTDNTFDSSSEIEEPVIAKNQIPLIENYDTFYNSSGDIELDNAVIKNTLQTIKNIFAGVGNYLGAYPYESEFLVDETSGRILGQKFINLNGNKIFKPITFKWDGNLLSSAFIGDYPIDLFWKDNTLVRIKIDLYTNFDYSISYDNQNNPIFLEVNDPSYDSMLQSFNLTYKDDKIAESILKYKTSYGNYIRMVKAFEHNNEGISVNTVRYEKGKPRESKFEIFNTSEYFRRISANEVEIKYVWNISGSIRTGHYSYRPDGQIKKTITHNLPSDRIDEIDKIYEGDNYIKKIAISTKGNIRESKEIVNLKDLLQKPDYTEDYQWRKGVYRFDSNDELIFESRDKKFREKKDGQWTSWQYIPY